MVKKRKKRVVVAMSSGVDSSVAAALLQKQGYEVVGIFMHFWKEPDQDELRENKCCSLEAQEDARKVCQLLGIPLYTANAEKEFKKEVVDYFLSECKSGRTPNPCVACNEHIKFTFLFRKMLEMEADFVASGHYARIERETPKNKKQSINKEKDIFKLYQGKDKEKDQSYFLYKLAKKQLSKIIFPVGRYRKSEIRKMAEKMKLPIFDKDDSQGLCFTPEKYPTEFLKRHLKLKRGKIVDEEGNVIGSHEGLPLYTIGQRRGINIGGSGPYYVAEKDLKKNILYVTRNEKDERLHHSSMLVENVNWISKIPKLPFKTSVKIRYRKPSVRVIIEKKAGNVYECNFIKPQKAVTPGQSAVFYSQKGELLGGGTIK